MGWIVLVVVIVLLAVFLVGMYNGLVRRRRQCENAWAQIDVQLKRRFDLIPNLINTVKGYAKHERELLENVTKARARVGEAREGGDVGSRVQAETALGGALRGLMVQVEAYPDLKANQNFLALQEELTSTENKIGFARQHYNDVATNYNAATETFPRNIVAGMFGFKERTLWEITDAAEREVPKVEF